MSDVNSAVPVLSPWEQQYPHGFQFRHGEYMAGGRCGQSRGAAGELLQRGVSYFSHRHCLALLSSGTKGRLGSDLWMLRLDLHPRLHCQGLQIYAFLRTGSGSGPMTRLAQGWESSCPQPCARSVSPRGRLCWQRRYTMLLTPV